jgi:hypothetical protein
VFRVPKWSIVAFVLLAVLVAYAIHHFGSAAFQAADYASRRKPVAFDSAIPGVSDQSSVQPSVEDLVNEIPEKLQRIAGGTWSEETPCQCTVAGHESANLELEKASQCGPKRLAYEERVSRLPPIFREKRAKNLADFPRTCLIYIMHKFLKGTETSASSMMSSCSGPNQKPARRSYKPCITANYVNSVYNAFADMTECLDVPQRDYLPKIFRESGFHINALGSGYDVGIGQLVGVSIEEANKEFKNYQRQVLNSENEACHRIAPYIKKFSPVPADIGHRCQLIAPPANPLLNIFYITIKYRQDLRTLESYMSQSQYSITARLTKLGLPPEKYDHHQLEQMLMILGFNAGIKGAVINLVNYLKAVEAGHRKLTLDDFDFSKESLIYAQVGARSHALTRRESESAASWRNRLQEFDEMMDSLQKKKFRYQPKVEKITLTSKKWGKYSTRQISFKTSELSFPAYLQLYQSSGARGYLSFVREAADNLNSVFKEGTCVPDSYLAL